MQKFDSERISKLVSDTVSMLCKNSVHFNNDLKIQGLIAVTSDSNKIYIIEISDFLDTVSGAEINQEVSNVAARAPVRRQLVLPSGSPPKKIMALMAPNSGDVSANNLIQRTSNTVTGQERFAGRAVPASLTQRLPRAQRPMLALPAPSGSGNMAVSVARHRPSITRFQQPNASVARQVAMPAGRFPAARRMQMVVRQGRSGQARMAMPVRQLAALRGKSRAGYLPRAAGSRAATLRAARPQQVKRVANNRTLAAPIVMPSPNIMLPSPVRGVQQSPRALQSPGNQLMPFRMQGGRNSAPGVQKQPQKMPLSVQSSLQRAVGPVSPRMLLQRPAGNQMQPPISPNPRLKSSQTIVSPHAQRLPHSSPLIVQRNEPQNRMQLSSPVTSTRISLGQQLTRLTSPRKAQPLTVSSSVSTPIHSTEMFRPKMQVTSQSPSQMQTSHQNQLVSPIASRQAINVASPQIIAMSASGEKKCALNIANQVSQLNATLQTNQWGNKLASNSSLASPNSNIQVKLIGVMPQKCMEQLSISHTQNQSSDSSSSVLDPCLSSNPPSTLETLQSHSLCGNIAQNTTSYACSVTCCVGMAKAVAATPSMSMATSRLGTMAVVSTPAQVIAPLAVQVVKPEFCGGDQRPLASEVGLHAKMLQVKSEQQLQQHQQQLNQQALSMFLDQSKNLMSPTQRQVGQHTLVTTLNQAQPVQMQNLQQFVIQRCALLQNGPNLQPAGHCVPVVISSDRSNQPLPQSQQHLQLVTPVQQSLQSLVQSSLTVPQLAQNVHQVQSPQWNRTFSQQPSWPNIVPAFTSGGQACVSQASQLRQSLLNTLQHFGSGHAVSQGQDQGLGQKAGMILQGMASSNVSDVVNRDSSNSMVLQHLNQPCLGSEKQMSSSTAATAAAVTLGVLDGVNNSLQAVQPDKQIVNTSIQKVLAKQMLKHSMVATCGTPIASDSSQLETVASAIHPKQSTRAESKEMSSLCSVQLHSQHTDTMTSNVSLVPAETLLSLQPGIRNPVAQTMSQSNQEEESDMPLLTPMVAIKSNEMMTVTNQKSQSAQVNRMSSSGSGGYTRHPSESPAQNLKAFLQNILVHQSDAPSGLLDTQLCISQSEERREMLQEPSSTSLMAVSRVDAKTSGKPSDIELGSFDRPLPSTENKFDLDAFAVSQVEKLVKMRLEEKLSIPEAESTLSIQPPNLMRELGDHLVRLPNVKPTANKEALLSERVEPSDVSQREVILELPKRGKTLENAESPSSTIAYSESPLRLSVSDLEEFEQNLANMTDNFNAFDEECGFRFHCRRTGCEFAGDAAELANHYTDRHTEDIDIGPVISDQSYRPLLNAVEPENAEDQTHGLPCPFPGCDRTFSKIGSISNHHQKAHKTSLTKKQKAAIVSKFGQLHRCDVCFRGFATKADLTRHVAKKRHGK